jgi:hypothetical protein
VSQSFFAGFWGTLAARYKNNPLVVFGIMNEVSACRQLEPCTQLRTVCSSCAVFVDRVRYATVCVLRQPLISVQPNGINASLWVSDANAAIAAIRAAGATNLLTVPGVDWTGACSFFEVRGALCVRRHRYVHFALFACSRQGNSEALLGISDPLHNYAIELHLYLDSDHSGTHPNCTSPTVS